MGQAVTPWRDPGKPHQFATNKPARARAFSEQETAYVEACGREGDIAKTAAAHGMTHAEAVRVLLRPESKRILDNQRAAALLVELAPRAVSRLAAVLDETNPLEAKVQTIATAAFRVLDYVDRKRDKENAAEPLLVDDLRSLDTLTPNQLEEYAAMLRNNIAVDAEFSEVESPSSSPLVNHVDEGELDLF